MSCKRVYRNTAEDNNSPHNRQKRNQRNIYAYLSAVCFILLGIYTSTLWMAHDIPVQTKAKLVQMSGNNGEFYKGSPDNWFYKGIDGIVSGAYYQYFYDSEGRMTKHIFFRPNERYEDVWCITDTVAYKYDDEGRIKEQKSQGDYDNFIYEYTNEGYTKTRPDLSGNGRDDTYVYDQNDNLIYQSILRRFAPGYEEFTTYTYDEQNRVIEEIRQTGEDSPFVYRDIEYDDEAGVAFEKHYSTKGKLGLVQIIYYNENGQMTKSSWVRKDNLPEGVSFQDCIVSPEEYEEYYQPGYWSNYKDGLLMEELISDIGLFHGRISHYYAYNYDNNGNCKAKLSVYTNGYTSLYKYNYDNENRLVEEFHYYIHNDAGEWEFEQFDGSKVAIKYDGENGKGMTVTHVTPDGLVDNSFLWESWNVAAQYTSKGEIPWYSETAEKDKETETPKDDNTGRYHIVQPGESLWIIAEKYWGDGMRYWEIYNRNREIIGDNPDIILPDMRLYIDEENYNGDN